MKTTRKDIVKVLSLAILTSNISNIVYSQELLDLSKIDKGIVAINEDNIIENSKVMITKDNISRTYNLNKNYYPLQLGNGKYEITILQWKKDNIYKKVKAESVDLNLVDDKILYLQATDIVYWNKDSKAILLEKKLNENQTLDIKKINNIYNYITKNIKYDFEKAKVVENVYRPNIDNVINSKRGICFDYATLNTAMLRSAGIPTKMVLGYRVDLPDFHAWNEVYINGKWNIIDTTYDSAYVQKNMKVNIFKNPKDYKVKEIY